MTPMKAIREKCIDCMCGQINEVKLCPCSDCSLHPFRMGKNPYRAEWSEERKTKQSERMKRMHENGVFAEKV